ncbi:hypothetical protein [Algicola sagamiensis]|uniref:hypothetical protein n=1 Tax=Algicola sagamiensis TaxID=163869 RepID=UPI00038102C5|nr:hypothetical protein [Algicola sagamiensis]
MLAYTTHIKSTTAKIKRITLWIVIYFILLTICRVATAESTILYQENDPKTGQLLGTLYENGTFIPSETLTDQIVLERLGYRPTVGLLTEQQEKPVIGKTLREIAELYYQEFPIEFAEAMLEAAFLGIGLDTHYPYGSHAHIQASIALQTHIAQLTPNRSAMDGGSLLYDYDKLQPVTIEFDDGSKQLITPLKLAAWLLIEIHFPDALENSVAEALFSDGQSIQRQTAHGFTYLTNASGMSRQEMARQIFGQANDITVYATQLAFNELGLDNNFLYGSIYHAQATIAKRFLLSTDTDLSQYTPEVYLATFHDLQKNHEEKKATSPSPKEQAATLFALMQEKIQSQIEQASYRTTFYTLHRDLADWYTQSEISALYNAEGQLLIPSRKDLAKEILQNLGVLQQLKTEQARKSLLNQFLEAGQATVKGKQLEIEKKPSIFFKILLPITNLFPKPKSIFRILNVSQNQYTNDKGEIKLNDLWSNAYNTLADKITENDLRTIRLNIFETLGESALNDYDQKKYYRWDTVQRFYSLRQIIWDMDKPTYIGFEPGELTNNGVAFKVNVQTKSVSLWDGTALSLNPDNAEYQKYADTLVLGPCKLPHHPEIEGARYDMDELICNASSRDTSATLYRLYLKQQFVKSKSTYQDLTTTQIVESVVLGMIPGYGTVESIINASNDAYADQMAIFTNLVGDAISIVPSAGPAAKGAGAASKIIWGTVSALRKGAVKKGLVGLSKATQAIGKGAAKSIVKLIRDASNIDLAIGSGHLLQKGANKVGVALLKRHGENLSVVLRGIGKQSDEITQAAQKIQSVRIRAQHITQRLIHKYQVHSPSQHVGEAVDGSEKLFQYLDPQGRPVQNQFALQLEDGRYISLIRDGSESLTEATFYPGYAVETMNQNWKYQFTNGDHWRLTNSALETATSAKAGYYFAPFATEDIVNMLVSDNASRILRGKSPYEVIVESSAYRDKMLESFQKWSRLEQNQIHFAATEYLQYTADFKGIQPSNGATFTDLEIQQILTDSSFENTQAFIKHYRIVQSYDWTLAHILDNKKTKILSRLDERSKLYVQGHGAPGENRVSTKPFGAKSTEDLVRTFESGGLSKDFQDIRITSCWSADTCQITTFKASTLAHSMKGNTKWKQRILPNLIIGSKRKTHPLARQMADVLKKKGYSQIQVTGYHGAGVTNSYEFDTHTLRVVFAKHGKTKFRRQSQLKQVFQ